MKKVNRPPLPRTWATGDPTWDAALCYFSASFPRLMAHVAKATVGPRTTLFLPVTPTNEPFGVLTLGGKPETPLDATRDLAQTLYLLARYLRYHARSCAAETFADPSGGSEPKAPTHH